LIDRAAEPSPLLVAVGSDASALRLVHAGFRAAREQRRPWVAVHVHVLDWESAEEAEQASFWLKEAGELGATTDWLKAPTLPGGILDACRKWDPATLILGHRKPQGIFGNLERTRILDFLKRSLDCPVVVLRLDTVEPQRRTFTSLADLAGLGAVVLVFLGITTLFGLALRPALGNHGAQILFALAMAALNHRWGYRVSLPATVAAAVLYEIWFRAGTPLDSQDLPALGVFLLILVLAQIFAGLAGKFQSEARAVHRMEAETALLMLLGRALLRCTTREEVAGVLAERSRGLVNARAWLLAPLDGEGWERLPLGGDPPPPEPPGALRDHMDRRDPLEPFFAEESSFLSLGGHEGFIQLHREDGASFLPEEWGLLQAFAGLGTVALERIRWHEAAHREKMEKERERMRNTLLGAVSHDLRTPLAAIQGAATSLLLPDRALPEADRKDLLVMIREESERLARFLGDLLELTRLQSGAIQVQKEWQPLDEIVGSAIVRLERAHGPLRIRAELPADLPLAHLDGSLMEQVLLNLLGNARRHAPGSDVTLAAWAEPDTLELAVSDRGPGVPLEFQEEIFQKFFQVPGLTRDGGVGLGLAICEAVVRSHGGRIWVEDRAGGGASFRITLPLEGPPPALPEAERDANVTEPQP
jgi:two-component system sensor histidine kinase KdpD